MAGTNRAPTWVRLCELFSKGGRLYGQTTYREGTRMFNTEVVTFVEPFIDLTVSNGVLIYVGVLHSSGSFVKAQPRAKEAFIGTVKVLNM